MNKPSVKKSKIVKIGDEIDATAGFTQRILLSLVVDVTELHETTERLKIQVYTLAKANGITPPKD